MQYLDLEIIKEIKNAKIKKLEIELHQIVNIRSHKEMVECPFCHYVGKNKRFTMKIFDNPNGKTMKCFACGIWRCL